MPLVPRGGSSLECLLWVTYMDLPILHSLAPVAMATQAVNAVTTREGLRVIHGYGHTRVNPVCVRVSKSRPQKWYMTGLILRALCCVCVLCVCVCGDGGGRCVRIKLQRLTHYCLFHSQAQTRPYLAPAPQHHAHKHTATANTSLHQTQLTITPTATNPCIIL